MARCDQGYLCEVCGEEVEGLPESDLYLRYVLGEVPPERLHEAPERHLHCNPALAQFIVDDAFEPIALEGPFAKSSLDAAFVAAEEARVSAGYRRLLELSAAPGSILDYPLAGPDTRQNLANLVDFGMKEPYMLEMNDFIREKREMMMVRRRHVAGVLLPSVVIPHGLHRSGPNRARCRATSTRWC